MAGLKAHKVIKRAVSAAVLIAVVLLVLWQGHYYFGALLGVIAGIAMAELWTITNSVKYKLPVFIALSIYVLIGAFLCYHLRELYGIKATLLFFLAIWASDTGAYFFGKFIGGAKMSPDISPNKTWAGYFGALCAPAVVLSLIEMRLDPLLIFGGIALGVAGQAGDLLISLLKRDARVKDSGDLIPGHGGFLDRVDSLIPAVIVYLALIKLGLIL